MTGQTFTWLPRPKRVTAYFWLLTLLASSQLFGSPREIRLAFFQPGDFQTFSLLREAYQEQLTALSGDSVKVVISAQLAFSAGWSRDSSRALSRKIASRTDIDLIVALGPWVVEDLLFAGAKQPIVPLARPFPQFDGLLDQSGRPRVDHLTVSYDPDKLSRELSLILELMQPKQLGLLMFECDSSSLLVVQARELLASRSVELILPAGQVTNNSGLYAFFRALEQLDKRASTIYTGPLLGLAANLNGQLLSQARGNRRLLISSDNRFAVTQGAGLSFAGHTIIAPARVAAWKTIRIAFGAVPADLPTRFSEELLPAVNLATLDSCRISLPLQFLASAELIPDTPADQPRLTMAELIESTRQLHLSEAEVANQLAHALAAQTPNRSAAPQLTLDGSVGWVDPNGVHNSEGRYSTDRQRLSLTLVQPLLRQEWLFGSTDKAAQGGKTDSTTLELAVALAALDRLRAAEAQRIEAQLGLTIDRLAESARARQQIVSTDQTDWIRMRIEGRRHQARLLAAEQTQQTAASVLAAVCVDPRLRAAALDDAQTAEAALVREFSGYRSIIHSAPDLKRIEELLTRRAETGSALLAGRSVRSGSGLIGSIVPDVDFRASASLFDSLAGGDSFRPKKSSWMVDLKFTLPIGRRTPHNAAFQDYTILLRDLERIRIAKSIQLILAELEEAISAAPFHSQAAELSATHLQLAMPEYDSGQRPLADLLDAIESMRLARLAELSNRFAYFAAALRLQRLVSPPGREFSLSLRQTLAQEQP